MMNTKRKGCLRTAGLLGCGGIAGIFALMVFVGVFVEKSETQTPAPTRNLAVLMPTLTPTPAPPTATPRPTAAPTLRHLDLAGLEERVQYGTLLALWFKDAADVFEAYGESEGVQGIPVFYRDVEALDRRLRAIEPPPSLRDHHWLLISYFGNCVKASEQMMAGEFAAANVQIGICTEGMKTVGGQVMLTLHP